MSSSTFNEDSMQSYFLRAQEITTIREALARPNLTLLVDDAQSATLSAAVLLGLENVSEWTDFNLRYLSDAFKDILDKPVLLNNEVEPGSRRINILEDLKSMINRDISPLLEQLIAEGAATLGDCLNQRFPRVTTGVNQLIARGSRRSALTFMTDPDETSLVVSCVLHANSWHSNVLQARNPKSSLPIHRIATYCLLARTRYGFILTSKELVVVRVSGTAGNLTAPCQVEWKAVPWGAEGENSLTVALSLWSLAMLSLREEHRSICARGQALPLNHWRRRWDVDRGEIFRHHISMREVANRPIDAIVEDEPTQNDSPFH